MKSPSTSQVRQWARQQGVQVGDRGRLPADLVARYVAAHDGPRRKPAATATATAPAPRASGEQVAIGRTIRAKTRWDWAR